MNDIELTGKNIVGGTLKANGASGFQAQNPANNTGLPITFYEATAEEVDEAVNKAVSAFDTYAGLRPSRRADFLDAIGQGIMDIGEELIERCMLETALPEARLKGERMRTVNQLHLFAELLREGSWVNARIDTGDQERQPVPKPDVRQMLKPLGPAGIFGASNFPLAFSVAGGDTASALAAGCPVIVKGHPLHPGTSELVGRAILSAAEKTGMPNGVFSLLQGHAGPGKELVLRSGISAIGFTGSFKGGKTLFDLANSRKVPVPVFAEMGSTNPVFMLPGAIRERAGEIAKGLAASVCLGAGQFCTNPGLVVAGSKGELLETLKDAMNAANPGSMLSRGIADNYIGLTGELISKKGVELVTAENSEPKVAAKLFSVNVMNFLSDPFLEEEIFGPSTLFVHAENKPDMLAAANSLKGHLTATIHGTDEDLEEYRELITILEKKAGRIIFNGYPTGVEVCHAMYHGGPFPATTAPSTTSVGTMAINRFTKPVCYQDFPQTMLPPELKDDNPLGIMRLLNGNYTRDGVI